MSHAFRAASRIAAMVLPAACIALSDFRQQVTDRRANGIPVATADAWLLTAADIKAAIGCSGGY